MLDTLRDFGINSQSIGNDQVEKLIILIRSLLSGCCF